MSYKESKQVLENLRAKHDESMFRMAISHLMDVGIRHLDEASCKHTCQGIMQRDDARAIMTNDFMCDIVWLAHELSKIPHIDLLVYIQRYVDYDANDDYPSYGRAISLLRSCVDWTTCDQLPEDALSDLYGIGFSDEEIEFVGFGNLLEMED
jgi:hypothetical protein